MKNCWNISLPLSYREELSKWIHDDLENCYAYAINLRSGISHLTPGELSGFNCNFKNIYSDYELISQFKADMKILGITVRNSTLDEKVTDPNSWKIVIMNVKTKNPILYDFHFMRQDSSGTWHHKLSGKKFPTNLDEIGNKIINPENAIFEYDYHVVEYFVLTK